METLMTEISKLLDSKNEEIKTLKWRVESLEARLKEYEERAKG